MSEQIAQRKRKRVKEEFDTPFRGSEHRGRPEAAETCRAKMDDEEEQPPSPRLLRRDSSQIEGRSLNWVLGTVYNVLNLPRRLSAQALATATTNPLRP